jgi:glycosyltransferase involved in cell wall biosynthesis
MSSLREADSGLRSSKRDVAPAQPENRQLLHVAADCGARRPTRIAVLNSHPIQYFAPLYAYLNRAPDLEITALYLSDFSIRGGNDAEFGREVKWDLDLLAGYRSVFVGKAAQTREPRGFWSLVAPQLWNELRSGRYDVLWLHGHQYAANFLALAAAKGVRMPVMMRGDTHLGLPCHGAKAVLRRPLMGTLYGWCDRLLAVGSENAAYYRAMGVPDGKIVLVPYAVDNDRFASCSNLTNDERSSVRKKYNIHGREIVVLYAAKFTHRKRPGDLLKAAQFLRSKTNRPFNVIMAGSGELEPELRTFCAENMLDNVIFTGFVNQSELPALYGASDIFVLPSEDEPWALAVNEAMCAGLPVVVSREVGCVPDLVRDGINGFTPNAGDIGSLAHALQHLIEDDGLRRRQGQASLARILEWSYRECLDGIRSAIGGLPLSQREAYSAVTAS